MTKTKQNKRLVKSVNLGMVFGNYKDGIKEGKAQEQERILKIIDEFDNELCLADTLTEIGTMKYYLKQKIKEK